MTQNYCADTPWGWRERLRFKLFPSRHCSLPEAPAAYRDVLVMKTIVRLDALDRLRVLITGRLIVETRTVTEHLVGGCKTASVCYPILRSDPPGRSSASGPGERKVESST